MATVRYIFGSFFILMMHHAAAQLVNYGDLYLNHTETMVVHGDLNNATGSNLNLDGQLYLKGNLSNSGSFLQDTGGIFLSGSSNQSITGNHTFFQLTLNNTAGAQVSSGLQQIVHTFFLTDGTFQTNDNLLLLSSPSRTARIDEIQAGADISGKITMERYLDNGLTGWHMLGTASSGLTLADWNDDFVTSGFPGSDAPSFPFINIYTYQESTPGNKDTFGYHGATNITNAIAVGEGHWVYIGPVPLTFDATGDANTFTQNLPVTYTNNANPLYDGWNMVANPYPSNIDWDAAGWTKTNIDDAIYFYDPDNGVYASYILGFGINGGTKNIASSQGFWVKCNNLFPVLSTTEAVKTASSAAYFRQKAGIQQAANIRLKVSEVGTSTADETGFRFSKFANKAWEQQYDAYKLEDEHSSAPYIASVLNDSTDLSINSVPEVLTGDSIPVRVKVKNTGKYLLKISRENELNANNCLIMEDLKNHNRIDLKKDTSYLFNMSDTVTQARFLIHSTPKVDLGEDRIINVGELLSLSVENKPNHTFVWSTGSTQNQISVSDTGWVWVNIKNEMGCIAKDSLHVGYPSTVHIEDATTSALRVFPNPANHYLTLRLNTTKGQYLIYIFNTNGVLMDQHRAFINRKRHQLTLDVSTYPAGTYLVEIKSDSTVHQQLFSIVR
jgi:hypothetical protein